MTGKLFGSYIVCYSQLVSEVTGPFLIVDPVSQWDAVEERTAVSSLWPGGNWLGAATKNTSGAFESHGRLHFLFSLSKFTSQRESAERKKLEEVGREKGREMEKREGQSAILVACVIVL